MMECGMIAETMAGQKRRGSAGVEVGTFVTWGEVRMVRKEGRSEKKARTEGSTNSNATSKGPGLVQKRLV